MNMNDNKIEYVPLEGVFGENANQTNTNNITQFASDINGTAIPSKDVNVLINNAIELFKKGFGEGSTIGLDGSFIPTLGNINALYYCVFRHICYLQKEGMAEYHIKIQYEIGSIVKNIGGTEIYRCKIAHKNIPLTNTTYWEKILDNNTLTILAGKSDKSGNLDQFADSTDGSNTVSTSGRDIKINGKKAVTGYSTADGNKIVINDGREYANGVEITGSAYNLDGSTYYPPSIKLNGILKDYITIGCPPTPNVDGGGFILLSPKGGHIYVNLLTNTGDGDHVLRFFNSKATSPYNGRYFSYYFGSLPEFPNGVLTVGGVRGNDYDTGLNFSDGQIDIFSNAINIVRVGVNTNGEQFSLLNSGRIGGVQDGVNAQDVATITQLKNTSSTLKATYTFTNNINKDTAINVGDSINFPTNNHSFTPGGYTAINPGSSFTIPRAGRWSIGMDVYVQFSGNTGSVFECEVFINNVATDLKLHLKHKFSHADNDDTYQGTSKYFTRNFTAGSVITIKVIQATLVNFYSSCIDINEL